MVVTRRSDPKLADLDRRINAMRARQDSSFLGIESVPSTSSHCDDVELGLSLSCSTLGAQVGAVAFTVGSLLTGGNIFHGALLGGLLGGLAGYATARASFY